MRASRRRFLGSSAANRLRQQSPATRRPPSHPPILLPDTANHSSVSASLGTPSID
ncbi:MAG UNVERIFIED_CONTAM: hypothetical protein LVR18_15100 [Planctomycetaceae bacterium]